MGRVLFYQAGDEVTIFVVYLNSGTRPSLGGLVVIVYWLELCLSIRLLFR